MVEPNPLLERLERYYDAAPRTSARAEDHGPLTLFVNDGPGWPFYARPTLGAWHGHASDVSSVRARQRALGIPQSFEWVEETSPWLRDAATAAGLSVHVHPLLVLDLAAWRPIAPPEGVVVRQVVPDDVWDADADLDLRVSRAVAAVAFAHGGTARGDEGLEAAPPQNKGRDDFARERLGRRLTVTYVAADDEGVLAVGSHQPLDGITEVVGVGTLPRARRRGLGAAVTSALVSDALAYGVDLVFLSAEGDAVARIYERLGFVRVANALIADPGELL